MLPLLEVPLVESNSQAACYLISYGPSLLSVTDIALRTTSTLISLVQDTQNTSTERRLLAEEAYSLSRLLERLRAQNASLDEKWLEDRTDILQEHMMTLPGH